MLPLVSKMKPRAMGSSSFRNEVIVCSTLSSKIRKFSFSSPVMGWLNWSLTVAGTSTRLVSTLRFAPGRERLPPAFGGRGVISTCPLESGSWRKIARTGTMPIHANARFTGFPSSLPIFIAQISGGKDRVLLHLAALPESGRPTLVCYNFSYARFVTDPPYPQRRMIFRDPCAVSAAPEEAVPPEIQIKENDVK